MTSHPSRAPAARQNSNYLTVLLSAATTALPRCNPAGPSRRPEGKPFSPLRPASTSPSSWYLLSTCKLSMHHPVHFPSLSRVVSLLPAYIALPRRPRMRFRPAPVERLIDCTILAGAPLCSWSTPRSPGLPMPLWPRALLVSAGHM